MNLVFLCFSISDAGAASSIVDELEKDKAIVLLLKVLAHPIVDTHTHTHTYTRVFIAPVYHDAEESFYGLI